MYEHRGGLSQIFRLKHDRDTTNLRAGYGRKLNGICARGCHVLSCTWISNRSDLDACWIANQKPCSSALLANCGKLDVSGVSGDEVLITSLER